MEEQNPMFRIIRNTAFGAAVALVGLAATATADAKTELTMYYPVAVGGPLTEVVDKLVADFEAENPDIDVNAIYAGNYNDARIKALAALKSGEPAQLAVMFSIDIYELIEQDAIIAFDDIVSSEEDKAWLKGFYPALMENGITDDKTWGIPFQRSTIVMYYNKDAFREAGLDPENPPQTWDELASMGKKLVKKAGDGTVERWGAMIPSTGYPYWMFGALTKQNGQVLMSGDGATTFFDAPATIEALEYWKGLGSEMGVMPEGTIEWGTLRQNFLEGKTAIMWHSTGNLTAVKDNASFDFGVAMLPSKVSRGTPTGGGNFYIFKDTSEAEQQAALKLIKFLTQPERTAEWSIKTGYIGTRPDAYETDKLKNYVVEFPPAAVARDQLEFATAELSTYQTGRVRKLLDDAIQAALTGRKSPAEALTEAQKAADGLLRRYR
jgi:sn-glycerol 3-phosphate transport system substrate-binding protein